MGPVGHELIDALRRSRSAVASERRAAVTGLGTMASGVVAGSAGHEQILAALLSAVTDVEPGVRLRSVRGLRRLRSRRAFAAVAQAIDDEDYATREAAVRTVIELDSDRAAQALIAAAGDRRVPVRHAALTGLRAVHSVDEDVVAALVTGLADADPSIQGAAMASLRAVASRGPGLAAVVSEVAEQGLSADSGYRREISIELLRQLKVPGHRERCLAALNDPDPRVRQRAERGLEGR